MRRAQHAALSEQKTRPTGALFESIELSTEHTAHKISDIFFSALDSLNGRASHSWNVSPLCQCSFIRPMCMTHTPWLLLLLYLKI